MYDAIVVGAGFVGSITARYLAEQKKKVLLLERRGHIAGNMYDETDEDGILAHQYGPHAFHANNPKVYEYLTSFCPFDEYRLTCMVFMNGKYTPSPFNFQTIDDYFSSEKAAQIKAGIKGVYGEQPKAAILEMLNSEDPYVKEFADFLFDNDYRPYTAKQWGMPPSEIDASVLARVPVSFSYQTGYFDDQFQALPADGFTRLFEKILDHPGIDLRLNTDAKNHLRIDAGRKKILFEGRETPVPVIYTGAPDELLDYRFGPLPYRSLRFTYETINQKNYQQAPIVAYPQVEGYTRITEYTKLPYQDKPRTKIAYEYPFPYLKNGETEPYYPIINDKNRTQYKQYADELSGIQNLYLCGRLADYRYYNMDQAIERAFEICGLLDGRAV